jgi:hypothetical protein
MSKPKRETDDLDEADLFYDEQLSVDDFLNTQVDRSARRQRAAWQQVEERNDVRRLRAQLEDWDDWELTDSH